MGSSQLMQSQLASGTARRAFRPSVLNADAMLTHATGSPARHSEQPGISPGMQSAVGLGEVRRSGRSLGIFGAISGQRQHDGGGSCHIAFSRFNCTGDPHKGAEQR